MPYLTKSRFKLALECTAKLYYNDNKQYVNRSFEDSFLKELATGGFQVGALAQCYYPGGVLIDTLDHQEAYLRTLSLLHQKDIIIFEAAFLYKQCFIRADILIKRGNAIELVEVKAKSYAPKKDNFFKEKNKGLEGRWEPYLYDIAFQTWVTTHCLQGVGLGRLQVTPYLMLVNKKATTSVEGLNQRFFYNWNEKKIEFVPGLCTPSELGDEILIRVKVSREVQYIFEQRINNVSFAEFIKQCADAVEKGEIIRGEIGIKCRKCVFFADAHEIEPGKLSGFHACWKEQAGLSDEDFKRPFSWELWSGNASKWLANGQYFIDQLNLSDLEPKNQSATTYKGISRLDRQELQRIKTIANDYSPYVHTQVLREYFSEWQYPFHCIDFETIAVALPFHKGMHPYEQVAFQFSHHILYEDGTVVHQSEWIDSTPGHFPNFDFVRALKKALEIEGTIFRYATHENTMLCLIHKQLSKSTEPDKEELLRFIEKVTTKKKGKKEVGWDGSRTMVDLRNVVLDAYYSLHAKGSNSIKEILPAVLNSSTFLQTKYSQPVYGSASLPSKNFNDFTWIRKKDGTIQNPYDLLEPVFSKEEDEILEDLLMDEESGIFDGGTAMAAYGKMQFTHMTLAEREKIRQALLRYCELDTLAMIMILEEFREVVGRSGQ